ncbi:MAG: phytoene/squalene synthase family protein [Acidobacteriota bacterium]|nr:phytoene/squalene synthase family protein [Acidobacteriota bacterium]
MESIAGKNFAQTSIKSPVELSQAYEFCRQITKKHAKSFYFSARFLKKEKRLPIYALYALCRLVDDEVDASEIKSEREAIAAVENWKHKLGEIYRNGELNNNDGQRITNDEQNLVLLAWRAMLQKYRIRQELPLELMRGVLMDTHVKRYESWQELYVYCFRVASTVGLMSSEIFGYEKPETLEYAEALGIAMQLTNILRDVREDATMSRIYLPQEDLRKFGVSEEQIFEGRVDDNFVRLMQFEIERARSYYRKAEQGIPLLEKDARFCVLIAARIYAAILNEIELQRYDVFTKRAHTTVNQKLSRIPRIWFAARKM